MGLSIWQLKRQLAYLAGKAAWAVTPQGLVYSGGSFVSEDLEGNFRLGSALIDGPAPRGGTDNAAGLAPFCRVRCTQAEWDRHSCAPRINKVSLMMWSTAGGGAVPGTPTQAGFDSHGINQVTGVLRDPTTPEGLSQGRDVDELIARFAKLHGFFVDSVDGFQGRCMATSGMVPVNGVLVLKRALAIEALNPLDENYYHPVPKASTSVAGSTVTVTLLAAPDRFDFKAYVVRRGDSPGDPAPTDPALGTDVPVVGTTAQATGLAAGTYNFAVFVGYDEAATGVAQNFSSPVNTSAVV